MNPERVRIDVSEGIADVRLTRADKHNGLDREMFASLNEAIDEIRADSSVRAVVLSGRGPSFCAGLDFASFLAAEQPIEDLLSHRGGEIANNAQRVAYGWQALEIPVIAALHGNCLGGGCQIALAADIRFAAPDTRISVMEIKWGLIPDMGLSRSLPRLVRADVAKQLVWSGRIVEAEEAHGLGLITALELDPREAALSLAAELASKSPDAIRRGKRLLEQAPNATDAEGLALEEELQRELLGSPNQIAAVQAGMSGRAAEFSDPEPNAEGATAPAPRTCHQLM